MIRCGAGRWWSVRMVEAAANSSSILRWTRCEEIGLRNTTARRQTLARTKANIRYDTRTFVN